MVQRINFERMLRIQEKRENPRRRLIQAPPERANHDNIYSRLGPQTGRIQKKTRGMSKRDLGELSRSKENAASYLQQFPI